MKIFVYLAVTIFAALSLACSQNGSSSKTEVVITDDGFNTVVKNEIVIDDTSFAGSGAIENQSRARAPEITRIASDGSRVTTAYDAFGNKIETRFFDDNPLLQMIALRTSMRGEKQISVFAQSGEVRQLPQDMLDKALTASANELATAAGIYEGRREPLRSTMTQTAQPPLQPMPSYKFPVQAQQTMSVPSDTVEGEMNEIDEAAGAESKTPAAPDSKEQNPTPKHPTAEEK